MVLSAAFVGSAAAQENACLRRTVPLTVWAADGAPVHGIALADLQAKFSGKAVKILSVTPDQRPHRIVILLDQSGSMAGSRDVGKWDFALSLARHPLQAPLSNSQFALLTFAQKINERIDFTADPNAVQKRLEEFRSDTGSANNRPRGRTAIQDAILAGLQMLPHPSSADIIYLVSDGMDDASHSNARDVREALRKSGVRLFATLLEVNGNPLPQTPEEATSQTELEQIVESSGGAILHLSASEIGNNYFLSPERRKELSHRFYNLYLGMTRNDLLEVEFIDPLKERQKWELRLSPDKQKHFKVRQVSYPRELPPCSTALPGH
jgi:Mg-chelatase subunit ChlD